MLANDDQLGIRIILLDVSQRRRLLHFPQIKLTFPIEDQPVAFPIADQPVPAGRFLLLAGFPPVVVEKRGLVLLVVIDDDVDWLFHRPELRGDDLAREGGGWVVE